MAVHTVGGGLADDEDLLPAAGDRGVDQVYTGHTCMNEKEPVSFPDWKAALSTSNLSPALEGSHTREVLTFLPLCKNKPVPATAELVKQHGGLRVKT